MYQRKMSAVELATIVLTKCFYIIHNTIYLNYSNLPAIYYIIHLLLLLPQKEVPKHPYRHLEPSDIEQLYKVYSAIAKGEYTFMVGTSGLYAVPTDTSILQPLFEIVAQSMELTRD